MIPKKMMKNIRSQVGDMIEPGVEIEVNPTVSMVSSPTDTGSEPTIDTCGNSNPFSFGDEGKIGMGQMIKQLMSQGGNSPTMDREADMIIVTGSENQNAMPQMQPRMDSRDQGIGLGRMMRGQGIQGQEIDPRDLMAMQQNKIRG